MLTTNFIIVPFFTSELDSGVCSNTFPGSTLFSVLYSETTAIKLLALALFNASFSVSPVNAGTMTKSCLFLFIYFLPNNTATNTKKARMIGNIIHKIFLDLFLLSFVEDCIGVL